MFPGSQYNNVEVLRVEYSQVLFQKCPWLDSLLDLLDPLAEVRSGCLLFPCLLLGLRFILFLIENDLFNSCL